MIAIVIKVIYPQPMRVYHLKFDFTRNFLAGKRRWTKPLRGGV